MNSANSRAPFVPAAASRKRDVAWIAGVALVYFATARFSLFLQFEPEGIAALWPPEGIFLSALLLTRPGLRPWLVAALFVADFGAERFAGTPPLVSAIYAVTLAADAAFSAWLLRRFVGEPITFTRIREVAGFLFLSVLLSNGLFSLVAAAGSELLTGTRSFWSSWQWWATSDGIGNLLVTPFVLGWASWAREQRLIWKPRRAAEGAVLFGSLTLLNYGLFGHLSDHKLFILFLPYCTFPFILWAALRFTVRGLTTALLIFAAVAVPFTMAGGVTGLSFAPGRLDGLIALQLFLAIAAIPSLFLVALVAERNRSQAALRQSEELHRITLLSVGDAVISTDTGGRVELLNPTAETLTGWRQDEARGRPLEEVFHIVNEGTGELADNPLRRVIREGAVVGLANHTVLVARNGNRRPIADSGAPIRDARGVIVGAVLVFRDQSVERAAEAALTQSAERYRLMFTQNPLPMWIYDSTTLRFLEVNEAAIRNYGYTPEEFRAMTLRDMRPPDDVAAVEDIVPTIKPGLANTGEWRHRKKDGTLIRVVIRSHDVDMGGRRARLVMAEDITERKQAEEALERERNLLRTLIDHIPDSIYVRDLANRFVLANVAIAQRLGAASPEELLGKQDSDFFPDAEAARLAGMDREVFAGKASINFEDVVVRPDGRHRIVLSTKVPLRDAHGTITALVGIGRDITEWKEAEQALAERNRYIETILENAPIGFAVNTIYDGKGLFVSSKFEEIYGLPRGSLTSVEDYFQMVFLDPVFREQIRARIMADMASGDAARMRWENIPITTTTGEKKFVTAINIPLFDQNLMVSTVQDVTGRHLAEAARQESEARYHTLASATFEGIALTEEGRILDLNDRLATMLGYPREELIGQPALKVVAPDSHTIVAEAIRTGRREPYEYVLLRRDGSTFAAESRARVVQLSGRTLRITSIRDITDQKRAEEQLRNQIQELRRWHNVTLGREDRVQSLKREVNQLLVRLGEPARYPSQPS